MEKILLIRIREDEWEDEWKDEWEDEWEDGWVDEWVGECITVDIKGCNLCY